MTVLQSDCQAHRDLMMRTKDHSRLDGTDLIRGNSPHA